MRRGWRSRTQRLLHPRQKPLILPEQSPFDAEKHRALREEAAFSLMDPDTHGFILFVMKRDDDGTARITFVSRIDEEWFTPFARVMRRVVNALQWR